LRRVDAKLRQHDGATVGRRYVCNWARADVRPIAGANVRSWWIADVREASQYGLMPTYEAIDAGVHLQAVASDLIAFEWRTDGITADFILPDDDTHALRVSFDRSCIVRLLDEMALSTEEEDTSSQGLVPNHFAYRLEGARFSRSQSEGWKGVEGPVTHYQFVTGWGCMDVISGGTPLFSVVPRSR
jgi:hypothetical protein